MAGASELTSQPADGVDIQSASHLPVNDMRFIVPIARGLANGKITTHTSMFVKE